MKREMHFRPSYFLAGQKHGRILHTSQKFSGLADCTSPSVSVGVDQRVTLSNCLYMEVPFSLTSVMIWVPDYGGFFA